MRFITILMVGFLLLTSPAFSELTLQDLDKIRAIVKSEVNASEAKTKEYISQEIKTVHIKIDELDKRLTNKIDAVDARLTDKIGGLDERLTGEIRGLDERLTGEIRGLDERLDFIGSLMIALISAIVVALGVPSILIAFLLRKQRTEYERIEAQQKQIDALRQEIEMYKQRLYT